MYQRLPTAEKIAIIQRVRHGESVAKVCREKNISRTVFYKWLTSYKKARHSSKYKALAARTKSGKNHWKAFTPAIEKKIIKLALAKPATPIASLAHNLTVSPSGVWSVLQRHQLSSQHARESYRARYGQSLVKSPAWTDKHVMMQRFEKGERASSICKDFQISKTAFYKWLTRYKHAQDDKKHEALQSRRPAGQNHWRFVPGTSELVIEIVVQHPEYSPKKISQTLLGKFGRRTVGVHGVYNMLKRLQLNTYQQRLTYARTHSVPSTWRTRMLDWRVPIFGKIPILSALPPPKELLADPHVRFFSVLFLSSAILSLLSLPAVTSIFQATSWGAKVGLAFSWLALLFGLFFFIYSLKYYLTVALVLSFSRRTTEEDEEESQTPQSFWERLFSTTGIQASLSMIAHPRFASTGNGLQANLDKVTLTSSPFVSIHLATYNEKQVVDRLLTAATSMQYDNYEVVLIDDSTDKTQEILKKWVSHPRVNVIHRDSRQGFKGGALNEALKHMNNKAEFILIFDADFIPYPDTITQFLKYFQVLAGGLGRAVVTKTSFAAIQGYQWHVLNKSENWITRGVRSEYAGSYVIERSASELYVGLKQIAGSVYMIRSDLLKEFGWGTSITEDFELTLKLYEKGYKVVYTPYIQAPAEAVSTINRLIRQRMRWAEGHSFNVKRMFTRLLFGRWETKTVGSQKELSKVWVRSPLSLSEKLDFLYLAPYYLQALFFIVGTSCWFLAEVMFQARLPFWTEVLGWSLVFTNMLSLPLMNIVGLFLEESEEKDYFGILSFVALAYIVAPFQAYAAVKGLFEREEGPWFRTPKTGRITDVFTPGRFYRLITGVFRRPQITHVLNYESFIPAFSSPYLALTTANNQFNSIPIRPKTLKWVGKTVTVTLLIFSISIGSLAINVPTVRANPEQYFLRDRSSGTTANYPNVSTSKEFDLTAGTTPTVNTKTCIKYGKAAAATTEMFFPTTTTCAATQTTEAAGTRGWFYKSQSGQYPSGSFTFTVSLNSSTVGATAGDFMLFASVYVYNGTTYSSQFYSIYKNASQACSVTRPARSTGTAIVPSTTTTDYTWTCTGAPPNRFECW